MMTKTRPILAGVVAVGIAGALLLPALALAASCPNFDMEAARRLEPHTLMRDVDRALACDGVELSTTFTAGTAWVSKYYRGPLGSVFVLFNGARLHSATVSPHQLFPCGTESSLPVVCVMAN